MTCRCARVFCRFTAIAAGWRRVYIEDMQQLALYGVGEQNFRTLAAVQMLLMAGSKADSLYMTEEALAKATSAKNIELFKIEGATHIEIFWCPWTCRNRDGEAHSVLRKKSLCLQYGSRGLIVRVPILASVTSAATA